MKSFNIRHIRHHVASALADVEQGAETEARRRGQPVARIVSLPIAARADWSHVAGRLRAAYPKIRNGGTTAARLVADGRGDR